MKSSCDWEQIINDGTTAGDIDARVKKNADPGGSVVKNHPKSRSS